MKTFGIVIAWSFWSMVILAQLLFSASLEIVMLSALVPSAIILAGLRCWTYMHAASQGAVAVVFGALLSVPAVQFLLPCEGAEFVKSALNKRLTPTELKSLRGNQAVCPDYFIYTRNGKVETAFGVRGVLGWKLRGGNG